MRDEGFEKLIAEARAQRFSGWDFSFLEGRYIEGKTTWDYTEMLRRKVRAAKSYLDLGTGGGELISSLAPLPSVSVVTEGFAPNIQVARRRLWPLGVHVVFSFCNDNDVVGRQRGTLPFRDAVFDLVSNRYEAFVASEVARVLRSGGVFVTQQVGPDNDVELARLMGGELRGGRWDLDEALERVEAAGLRVTESGEEAFRSRFLDVGALAYYLKAAGPLEPVLYTV